MRFNSPDWRDDFAKLTELIRRRTLLEKEHVETIHCCNQLEREGAIEAAREQLALAEELLVRIADLQKEIDSAILDLQ